MANDISFDIVGRLTIMDGSQNRVKYDSQNGQPHVIVESRGLIRKVRYHVI